VSTKWGVLIISHPCICMYTLFFATSLRHCHSSAHTQPPHLSATHMNRCVAAQIKGGLARGICLDQCISMTAPSGSTGTCNPRRSRCGQYVTRAQILHTCFFDSAPSCVIAIPVLTGGPGTFLCRLRHA
jgi:hypothetical protein